MDGNDICSSPLLGDYFTLPYIGNEVENWSDAKITSVFKNLCSDAIRARGLVVFKQGSSCRSAKSGVAGWFKRG